MDERARSARANFIYKRRIFKKGICLFYWIFMRSRLSAGEDNRVTRSATFTPRTRVSVMRRKLQMAENFKRQYTALLRKEP